jgi:hypothetical protein
LSTDNFLAANEEDGRLDEENVIHLGVLHALCLEWVGFFSRQHLVVGRPSHLSISLVFGYLIVAPLARAWVPALGVNRKQYSYIPDLARLEVLSRVLRCCKIINKDLIALQSLLFPATRETEGLRFMRWGMPGRVRVLTFWGMLVKSKVVSISSQNAIAWFVDTLKCASASLPCQPAIMPGVFRDNTTGYEICVVVDTILSIAIGGGQACVIFFVLQGGGWQAEQVRRRFRVSWVTKGYAVDNVQWGCGCWWRWKR